MLAEVEALGVQEVVLVAQDLASYGRDQGRGERGDRPAGRRGGRLVDRVRLLYLYPSDLTDGWSTPSAPPACPTSTCRCSTSRRRSCAACAAGVTDERFLARIADIRGAGAGGGLPLELHRGLPGRDRGRPRPAARASWRRRSSTGAASSPSPRGGDLAAGLDGEVAAEPGQGAPAPSWASCRTHHRRRAATG